MIMVIGLSLLLVVPTHMDAKEVYFRHGSKDSGKARTVLPQVTGVVTLGSNIYIGIVDII